MTETTLQEAPPAFEEFAKIARLSREIIVTEKIDGTNAQVYVGEDGRVLAGSRNRWLTVDADNFGFARWVHENEEELRKLGPGRHYGEWWGSGIQRRYGLDHKRFSLFNVHRWADTAARPTCCHVVPTIATLSMFDTRMVDELLATLALNGSFAAPGFMKPEGVVIYHPASKQLFKKTIEKDEEPKGKVRP